MNHIEAFFPALLHSVNDAVTIVSEKGIVLFWNDVAENMYDIKKEKIIGSPINQFFQKGSLMLFQVMQSGNPVYKVYHNPRPGMHVFVTTLPVYDREKLIGAISIEQDITHLVRLNEELFTKPESEPLPSSSLPLIKSQTTTQQNKQFIKIEADQTYPILFVGESGTGKRSLAQMLHHNSHREGSFIAVNCSSIPSGLIDTEIFGYEKDFLGEINDPKTGKLELAEKGTLYLKDIHTLPLSTQDKLAEVITDGSFTKMGGTTSIQVQCRVIASTNLDVEINLSNGTFLKNLYYLFQTKNIPSLKDRKEDLPELLQIFLIQAAKKLGKPVPKLSSEVLTALTTYDWPGNLIQLRNAMEHLVISYNGSEVTSDDLPAPLRMITLSDLAKDSISLHALSEEMEISKIKDAFEKTGGNKAKAARLLGISRGSLYYKIKQYGL